MQRERDGKAKHVKMEQGEKEAWKDDEDLRKVSKGRRKGK